MNDDRPYMEKYYDRTSEQSYGIWRKREGSLIRTRLLIALIVFVGVGAGIDYLFRNSKVATEILPPDQVSNQVTVPLSTTICFVPIIIFGLLLIASLMMANKRDSSELKRHKPAKQPKEPKKAQPIEQPERRKSIAQLKQEEIDKQRQQYQEEQHRERAAWRERKKANRKPRPVDPVWEMKKVNEEFWKSIGAKSPEELLQEERIRNIMNMHTEED